MGNYLCGDYVILNHAESQTDNNRNGGDEANRNGGPATKGAEGAAGDSQLSTLEISRQIQRSMLRIRGDFMSEDGRKVDYDAVKASDAFAEYLSTARLLGRCSLASLDDDENERKAFFINVYNALNIHGIIQRGGLPESLTGKLGYWKRTGYLIDGLRFTLDDIEHGILRGNSRASSQLWGNAYFADADPRLCFALPKDARIHFALNCGARSCPAIRVYDGRNLERGLTGATIAFCESEVRLAEGEGGGSGAEVVVVRLSHLFKWFRGDFVPRGRGRGDPVLRWIAENTGESDLSRGVRRVLESDEKVVAIAYTPYDWTSNGL